MNKKLIRLVTVPLSFKHLIKGQAKFFSENGFDVELMAADGKERVDVENYEQVPYTILDLSREITPRRDMATLQKLIKLYRTKKPDIVHSQTPKAGLIGMMAAKIAGVPKRIHTVGGLPILEATGRKRQILTITEKITSACATQVLVNSHALARIMADMNLCPAHKLKVLGHGSSNGIDTDYFSPDQVRESKEELRSFYNIPSNALVFVFIGRIVRDKGINELAEAFERLSQKNPDIYLLMVGPEEQTLDPISDTSRERLTGNSRVIMTGYQHDVRPFLKMSDVLVFPTYREGFPNVPMQAGAFGLPSIVTDINGCNEIISDGKNGWIIPPKNGERLYEIMDWIIANPAEIARAGESSQPFIIQHFSQPYIWGEIKKVYDG